MSPIKKDPTVTVNINGKTEMRVIRVDTAVNPGNSGGGLFNSKGELIGIVNAKIISSDVENIGYAIPSSVAINVADNIINHTFQLLCICNYLNITVNVIKIL